MIFIRLKSCITPIKPWNFNVYRAPKPTLVLGLSGSRVRASILRGVAHGFEVQGIQFSGYTHVYTYVYIYIELYEL